MSQSGLIARARQKAYVQVRYIPHDFARVFWDYLTPNDLKYLYVEGEIDVDEFERYLDVLLRLPA